MKITKTQLKRIIKEELETALGESQWHDNISADEKCLDEKGITEAASPDSPGLLRAIWDMLKGEFEEEYHGSYKPDEDDMAMSQEEREKLKEKERRKRNAQHSTATSHRDAYYSGGHYDPTLEEMIKKEVRKLSKTKK